MIIYFNNGHNYFQKYFEENGDLFLTPYSNKLKVKLIKILEKCIFFNKLIYNQQIVDNFNNLTIIFDSNISQQFLRWVVKKAKGKRVVFWYWNPVKKTISPDKIPNEIEIWSYSKADIEKYKIYNIRYNTQFFFDCLVPQKKYFDIKTEVFFLGRIKHREDMLDSCIKLLRRYNIKTKAYVVADERHKISKHEFQFVDEMNYDAVLQEVATSRALLDLYLDNQAGLSLRVMEALFFNKKLITNNINIDKFDFYSAANIFIIGKDNEKNLEYFIYSECKEICWDIKCKYLYSSWLQRFNK